MTSQNRFEVLGISLTFPLAFCQIEIKLLQEVMALMEYLCLKG